MTKDHFIDLTQNCILHVHVFKPVKKTTCLTTLFGRTQVSLYIVNILHHLNTTIHVCPDMKFWKITMFQKPTGVTKTSSILDIFILNLHISSDNQRQYFMTIYMELWDVNLSPSHHKSHSYWSLTVCDRL